MFRFTIRELLLLTLVAALGIGWWADHYRPESYLRQLERKAAAMQRALEDKGFLVGQDDFGVRIYREVKPDGNSARFGITIRELLLSAVIVGLGVAWWLDRRRLRERNHEQ